jgi:hypothetical protein
MADERPDGAMLRWILAGIAAVVGVGLIAWLIATVIPQVASQAVPGSTDADQLTTACRVAGPADGEVCQRALRVFAAIDEGQCDAARVQAAPVLAVGADASPLARKVREVVEARLAERCPSTP